ncbi:MAG: cytochrome c [Gemmatimonadetes bacterium]|nr:cytochrome c [Gemmatimonadota bacterium]
MMPKIIDGLKHPLGQAIALTVGAFLFFKYGIPLFPGSAPVPNSVVLEYTLIAMVGVLVFVSDNEARWKRFKEPIHDTLVNPERRVMRGVLLAALPLLIGAATFNMTRPRVGSTAQLRAIHPAPPASITFNGQSMQLAGLENPLRSRGSIEEHYLEGRRIYYQNCLPCHGDLLDGKGHFGPGYNPTPLSFAEAGTIDQLQESFLFWRVAKGGPGLPREGTPWNSAMPVWEDFLTEEEIWAVILFLYEQAGLEPRTWGEEGEGRE